MKKKPFVLIGAIIGLLVILTACGQGGASPSSSSSSQENLTSDINQEANEVLGGKVKEASTKETQRIVLESLVPEDKQSETIPFDEVILLTEGVKIVDGKNQEMAVEQIEAGAKIEVTLVKNSPIASSLPPQIPGMSIIKIVVPEV